jgi:polynucleotide 5'-hydroxyl-kinase GRC3/NOL9
MSAFAALQGQDAASVLRLNQHEDDDDDDDGVLQYNPNSSDSEPEMDRATESIKVYGTTTPIEPSMSVEPGFPPPGVWKSNFIPNEYNCIFNENHVLIGLQESEYIVVMGQLKLTILSGAMLINHHHYYVANPSSTFPIIAPQSQAVPILSSTQLKGKSQSFDENNQILPKKFLTVIKLENMFTGLEQVGKYYPPFKRFFDVNTFEVNEPQRSHNKFNCYSFDVILQEKGVVGLSLSENWSQELDLMGQQCTEEDEPHIYMIIGSKNSGKSTFSKALLNQLLSNSNVSYLDMDPGQSEFSPPYSLTLTSISKPILGLNTYVDNGSEGELKHYFGFTTPLHQPTLYVELITHLFRHYLLVHKPKGNHLIINTPGWIKGYGKEILIELTKVINPTKPR